MFKILRNYLRDQRNNLLQLFGLGFLVIIMVTAFLSLNFSTTFVTKQFFDNIAHNELHQKIIFDLNNDLQKHEYNDWSNRPFAIRSWLNNLDYYQKNGSINLDKLSKATFALTENSDGIYTFIYNGSINKNQVGSPSVYCGSDFAAATGHNYIQFRLSKQIQDYYAVVNDGQSLSNLFDKYVSKDPNNVHINYWITSNTALESYNKNIYNKSTIIDTPQYDSSVIAEENILYQTIVASILYNTDANNNANLSWERAITVNDLIMTGKTFTFIQVDPNHINPVTGPEIVASVPNFNINKLKTGDILVYQKFAEANNLKLGDKYVFAGNQYTIKGFATSPLAFSRHYYFSGSGVDSKNDTVAFARKQTIDQIANFPYSKTFWNCLFAYNPNQNLANNNKWLYDFLHKDYNTEYNAGVYKTNYLDNGIDVSYFFSCMYKPSNYFTVFEYNSIFLLNSVKNIISEISSIFLILIFVVTVVIIFIIIYKMIDRNKQLIGILKANGYQSWKLNINLVLAIVGPLFLFSVVGSVVAFLVSKVIIGALDGMFALISVSFVFYWLPTILVIFLPVLALFIINFVLVAFLLKTPALMLINNSWNKRKYDLNISSFFTFISTKLIRRLTYRNKLLVTNTLRTSGKMLFIILTSIFASTLLLFSFASSGLVNNMLGLQFASIDYNYGSQYLYNSQVINNFYYHNEPLYKKESVTEIRQQPSLYLPIKQAIENIVENYNPLDPNVLPTSIINFRYGYIMGSQLLEISNLVNDNLSKLPQKFQNWWDSNKYFINYLTNNNGQSKTDLMITFGLLPYNQQYENPYTEINLSSAYRLDINDSNNKIFYNNKTNQLENLGNAAPRRQAVGVNNLTSNYLKIKFKNTSFANFNSLNINNMETSSYWLDQNFIKIRSELIKKLGIENYDTSSVKIVPMVCSTAPTIKGVADGGDGNDLGKTVIYKYNSIDHQVKYIIGIVYDGSSNLMANQILMPEKWLNWAVLGNDANKIANFANAKFSNLNSNELQNYLPIISKSNDYQLDISQLLNNSNYFASKGFEAGLSVIYDVNSIKTLIVSQQYTFQTLLTFFAIFSIILSFMIIVIITNINVRDNLILINVLKSLGYSSLEISYIFLAISLPLLIIFGMLAVYIAPPLTLIVADALTKFSSILFPVVFKWWYFALSILVSVLIYLFSFVITWKINVKNDQLMKLTK